MPREACEFCRRARVRHKTRKKAGVFWYSSRGLGRMDWKHRTAKLCHKSSAMLAVRDKSRGINEVDNQNELGNNARLQALVDLFKKENEVEEVPSPTDSASILSESVNNVEAVDEPLVLTHAGYQTSKEAVSAIESRSAEKTSLVHFKINETTLQQCVNLLQSLSTEDECMGSGCR
uniref:THAP-type domain-containing protein n=1 Tax=Elaeophora elaphi TaxID=1147741 RepID=A0A0R3RUT6_9BILA